MRELRVGMTLRPQRLVVEQGPVTIYADLVGADDPVHRSAVAARAAGWAAPPVPPTFPFVLWHWGAHPDLQDGLEDGDLRDLLELTDLLQGDGGTMLHGEQEFGYVRPLLVGEVVVLRATVTALADKVTRDGRAMRLATVESELRDAAGDLVLTMTATFMRVR